MRIAVFVIALLNLGWFLALLAAPPSFPDGAGHGWLTLIGLVLAIFLIPAIVLAAIRKVEWLALILVLIPLLYVLNGFVRTWVS